MKVEENKSMFFPVVVTSFEILMIDRPHLERHLWQVRTQLPSISLVFPSVPLCPSLSFPFFISLSHFFLSFPSFISFFHFPLLFPSFISLFHFPRILPRCFLHRCLTTLYTFLSSPQPYQQSQYRPLACLSQYIILDEGHRIKNRNCRLVKELKSFRSVSRLLLTGTPIQVG